MNPADPADVKLVNDLQDKITIKASSANPFPAPKWDKESMLALRAQYEKEFQKFAQYEPDWMGPRGRRTRRPGIWQPPAPGGLFPEKDAVYINYTGPADPGKCYTATYQVPEHKAFWLITVYGKDGFMKSDNNIVNDRNVTLNDKNTFTVYTARWRISSPCSAALVSISPVAMGVSKVCGRQVGVADVVPRVERLLDPDQVELLELAAHPAGAGGRSHCWLASTMKGKSVAEVLAECGDAAQVLARSRAGRP